MNYTAIILAAGSGTRMCSDKNKIFLTLNHQPILSYSIDLFSKDIDCKQIIVVGKADEISAIKQISGDFETVIGGTERQDSVQNGLAKVRCEYVMIHDGARPFITKENLDELKLNVVKDRATLLAVPVKDTIKQVNDLKITATVPRENLYQAQTPQVFLAELIKQAHQKAKRDNFYGTDDTSLVEAFFETPVSITIGSYENIKITTPEDIYIAEAIVRRRKSV